MESPVPSDREVSHPLLGHAWPLSSRTLTSFLPGEVAGSLDHFEPGDSIGQRVADLAREVHQFVSDQLYGVIAALLDRSSHRTRTPTS